MKVVLIALITLVSFSSCEKDKHHNNVELTLNDGVKWKVNEETQKGMNNMSNILKNYNLEKSNFSSLGEELSKETKYIIENCDMKGKDHEMLHIILHPMLDNINSLKEGNGNDANIEQMNDLLQKYFIFFEKE